MSTTEVVEHEHHDGDHEDHMADRSYILIAALLGVLTLVEVSTYFWDFRDLAVPVLLILMVVKFAVVVAFFMHLKTDNRIFRYVFVSGLILAVGVYLVVLTMFHFWSGDLG